MAELYTRLLLTCANPWKYFLLRNWETYLALEVNSQYQCSFMRLYPCFYTSNSMILNLSLYNFQVSCLKCAHPSINYLIVSLTLFQIFERILFIWAIRHPASGYVQGINDLVTPFFIVFVCEYIGKICLNTELWVGTGFGTASSF